ncbi:MAG: glutamate racemase [Lachnospiraceae bacterium]|nr:glutamate racemase [Lachnospiraceae bacterium]MBR3036477.1 glutamate racemase [Lachnospiraceae bacterium]
MENRNAPIGIFDSGLGGLTVAREVIRQIPNERIVYFGDTARVPYGSKSKDTIRHYSEQIVNFLYTKDVKAIVVACNTASAYALEEIRDEVKVPIIGVVKPGAFTAAKSTRNQKIGVIGTEGTVHSDLYKRYIRELDPSIEVFQKACPLLCPLVEEGWWHDEITTSVVRRYLRGLTAAGIDTLILGCTHYPLIRSTIRSVVGERVTLINPAYETALELKRLLQEKELLSEESLPGSEEKYRFYVSDDPGKFDAFASSVLEFSVSPSEKVHIEAY